MRYTIIVCFINFEMVKSISKTNITSVFNALHYKGVKFIAN